ncbi:MAG: SIS domain-containing protein [Dermatophilaceae bacterium]
MAWIDEARLDRVDELESIDRSQSLRMLATAGAQVRRAVLSADESGIERWGPQDRPRSVLVAALGGSAPVPEVLELLAEQHSPVPVTTRRGGPLPGWVGALDLVIAVSQSGRAAGPLRLAAEAARRGARLLTIGASDSPLAEVCARARGVHVDVATPTPSSRTALWSLLTPALRVADRLGIVDVPSEVFEETATILDARAEECRPSSESFVNPAKELALALSEAVPLVLGDGPLAGVAAGRMASMLTRTARLPATRGTLPDDAAQVVACFDGPLAAGATSSSGSPDAGAGIFRDPFLDGPATLPLALFLLRDAAPAALTPEEVDRENLASAIAASAGDSGVRVRELRADAASPLARLASLVALGDYAATYAALGLGLDPTGSAHVADLRARTR